MHTQLDRETRPEGVDNDSAKHARSLLVVQESRAPLHTTSHSRVSRNILENSGGNRQTGALLVTDSAPPAYAIHCNTALRLQHCPIETVRCSACAPHCRDMHIITECYVSMTSRIWCAIRASSNLFCALSIIIFFTTE